MSRSDTPASSPTVIAECRKPFGVGCTGVVAIGLTAAVQGDEVVCELPGLLVGQPAALPNIELTVRGAQAPQLVERIRRSMLDRDTDLSIALLRIKARAHAPRTADHASVLVDEPVPSGSATTADLRREERGQQPSVPGSADGSRLAVSVVWRPGCNGGCRTVVVTIRAEDRMPDPLGSPLMDGSAPAGGAYRRRVVGR